MIDTFTVFLFVFSINAQHGDYVAQPDQWYAQITAIASENIYPATNVAEVGNPAVFKCFYEGPVSWVFNNQVLNSDSLLDDGHIALIRKVYVHNSGHYHCVHNRITSRATLYVIGKHYRVMTCDTHILVFDFLTKLQYFVIHCDMLH